MGRGSDSEWTCVCGARNASGSREEPAQRARNPEAFTCSQCGAERVGERGVPRLMASNSFTVDEVMLLDALFTTLMRGGDARILARQPSAKSLARKVVTMRKTIDRKKKEREG